jgi:hypothetical protein
VIDEMSHELAQLLIGNVPAILQSLEKQMRSRQKNTFDGRMRQ